MVRSAARGFAGVALLMVMAPVPAGAAVLGGACVIRVTVQYGGITVAPFTGGAFAFSSAGSGSTCVGPGSSIGSPVVTTTVDFDSVGTSSVLVKSCGATVASGSYIADFPSFFADSSGTFSFAGDLTGATLVLSGTAPPVFSGIAELAFDPLAGPNVSAAAACPTATGTTTITYIGLLEFVEIT